jgi:hypothetical protein
MRTLLFSSIIFLTGCSYSITMAHTNGTATDLIEEAQTTTPTTSVSVPVSLTK